MGAAQSFKPRANLHDRFMSKIQYDTNGGCWLWDAANDGSHGYGRFGDKGQTGQTIAHRAAYVLFCGAIPNGMQIDHLCRIPACVNPAHLEAVSPQENMRRSSKLGLRLGGQANGKRNRRKTHCPQGHEYALTAATTPQGWRYCKQCKTIKQTARNRRNAMKKQES